jgi:predicted molibdopterin-dependent oxidoreductase YjgC
VVSDPDSTHVKHALESAEFFMAIDIFPTPTTRLAHVVLPAASFAEVDGTFSNSERRVQRVRKAIDPIPGKTNWQIIQELSTLLGYPMHYESAEEIFNEMAALTPSYAGISYARLAAEKLCWPCPTPDHPGTPVLHVGKFTRGRGLFHAVEYKPPAETPEDEYPFWMTTSTEYAHYLTGTMTRRCEQLHREMPELVTDLNPISKTPEYKVCAVKLEKVG